MCLCHYSRNKYIQLRRCLFTCVSDMLNTAVRTSAIAMTSCPGSLFTEVVMDRHNCLVQSYLECARHALGSSVTSNIFRAQTGMRVRGHTSFSVLSSSKSIGCICLTHHGPCPGAEDHPAKHLLGCRQPMSFAGQCARSVSLTVWSWSTIPVSS